MSAYHRKRTRPIGVRKPKKVVLIVSEGRKTEVFYIKGLQKNYPHVTFHIKNTNDNDMINNFEKIQRTHLSNKNDYDIVFLIFDKDKKDNQMFDNFISKPGHIKIWSNPCFEIWLLFHFSYYQTKNDCTGIINNLDKSLKQEKISPFYRYDKTKKEIMEFFVELEEEQKRAISYAKKLIEGKKPSQANPGTNFFLLLEELSKL